VSPVPLARPGDTEQPGTGTGTGTGTGAGRPLVQVALTVRDLDRARAFYRDVLGRSLMFEVSGMMT
jgi:hypothetical protein